jgi:hypothetical protein
MDQKNILPRGIAKPIEQQPDGTWIVRHHFRVVGTSENGEELVTFASSEYPEKPTLQQIQLYVVKTLSGISLKMPWSNFSSIL